MPVITFHYQDFKNLLGFNLPKKTLTEKLPMIGADLDSVDGDEISLEVFPDRPDLASVEGLARAARAFFGFKTGLQHYTITPSDIVLTVDPSVKSVRPYVVTALIKGVSMTDELISSLMDLQEKLHFGLGRNRKKVAIGVHNYEPVTPPFTYKAVDPDAVSFVPLAKDESMTMREILQKHEKGIDYAHLLESCDRYPLIVDTHNNVLSFPPIINGSLTEVTPFTTDIFIDVTGSDKKAITYALNIVVTALAERGGKIYSTHVKDGKTTITSPDFTPRSMQLSIPYVQSILDSSFTAKQITTSLEKMGYTASIASNTAISVSIPAWRSDILHEIDLVEDVAIGYGYDQFTPDFPTDITIGGTLPNMSFYTGLRQILIGLGFNEVTTFTISNERDEFTRLGAKTEKRVEIANPIGEEYSCLRVSLLPSLLKILCENRHHPLPQQIFELGIVVDKDARNHHHLAAAKIDAKAHFTECKSLVEAVLRDAGLSATIHRGSRPAFIEGRCATIKIQNREVGFFGELHPQTIVAFELNHPVIAFELYADILKKPKK